MDGINNSEMILPLPKSINASELESHVWHLFVVRCQHRAALQKYLTDNGLQTLIHYPVPPHQQSAYRNWEMMNLPISEKIHNEVLSLPMGPTLTVEEVTQVIKACNNFSVSDASL
jgi:dTDP-4-amino-4,6-dideoxygalactose transaminase